MELREQDFLVQTSKGLYCPFADFYLDPKRAVDTAVISHAHADHAVAGHRQVYCTAPTEAMLRYRYKNRAGILFSTPPWGEAFMIKDVAISFFPAGHILGSAQVLMEYKSQRWLYTGDFKLQSDASCEPFEFVKADVLVTECTFGDVAVEHAEPEKEIEKLSSTGSDTGGSTSSTSSDTGSNILLGAYVIGKAQHITSLISTHCPDKQILIHPDIIPFHRIYEKYGINSWKWQPFNRSEWKRNKNCVYIVPPAVFRSYTKTPDVLTAFPSGWDKLQTQCDIRLMISDHADWKQLLLLLEKVSPNLVYTLHGDGTQLKKYCVAKGIGVGEMVVG